MRHQQDVWIWKLALESLSFEYQVYDRSGGTRDSRYSREIERDGRGRQTLYQRAEGKEERT